ncbi:hypothetical protein DFH06DRAFT_1376520 [Mycena polygramma]|nr:hypothetical protein DFH06DRAFT_1376520 [Mycena polygramma]
MALVDNDQDDDKARDRVHIASRDPEIYAPHSFRNLNMHGAGSPTDFKKTVGNVGLEALSGVRGLVGIGDGGRKIRAWFVSSAYFPSLYVKCEIQRGDRTPAEIIRDFDGLLRAPTASPSPPPPTSSTKVGSCTRNSRGGHS